MLEAVQVVRVELGVLGEVEEGVDAGGAELGDRLRVRVHAGEQPPRDDPVRAGGASSLHVTHGRDANRTLP